MSPPAARWEQYLLLRNADLPAFWTQHFSSKERAVLFIIGRGFDPRMCLGLEVVLAAGGGGPRDLLGLDFREGATSASVDHKALVDANWEKATTAVGTRGSNSVVAVEFWSQGRRVSSQSARDIFKSVEQIEKYTDVVVDISSMPRSVYFPMIARLLFLLDHRPAQKTSPINLHAVVAEDPDLDASIQPRGIDEKADFMASFGGGFDEEAIQTPKVWLPMLGENRRIQMGTIYDRVKPDEICPVLPSPSRDPRRADNLVIEYQSVLFDQYHLDARNFLYASEQNPFEVYRRLRSAVVRYDEVFALLGGCRVAISPLASKLMSLGALLAAYELKVAERSVGIAHVESQNYQLNSSALRAELFGLWLAGECDVA